MATNGLESASSPIHVAIIGAGIGGLALAGGLLRHGVSFTLFEAAPAFSTVGAGVGLGPNALRAMEALTPGFRAEYDAISSGNLTRGKKHVMMDAMLVEEGFGEKRGWKPISWGADCYERTSAHRSDLLDILTKNIPADVVRFGMKATGIERRGQKMVVVFENGETAEADAVIGCDGVRGISRATVLGTSRPDLVHAKFTGKYLYRAVVPMKDALEILGDDANGNPVAGDARMFMGKKAVFTTFPISRGTELNVVCFRLTEKLWTDPEWTVPVTREAVQEDLQEADVDHRLIKLLDVSKIFLTESSVHKTTPLIVWQWSKPLARWALFDHPETSTYFNDRVCLLGDSAHATTPHQAAGAGQCIEDALVLSSVLSMVTSADQVVAAFESFDSVRRPRAQKIVLTSREAGDIYALKGDGTGRDLTDIIASLNTRFLWIWAHDLQRDIEVAKEEFRFKRPKEI